MIPVLDFGYVRLVESWGRGDAGEPEAGIIEAARQSTQGSFRGWERDEQLLRFLFTQRPPHTGPFEFAGMVLEIQDPTCVVWEWVRHRTQSYAIMSSRYGPVPDADYLPTPERCLLRPVGGNKQASAAKDAEPLDLESAERWLWNLHGLYHQAEAVYQDGIRRGIPYELARLALTFGRYWRMRASANLLNWLKFLTLRDHPHAQHEIQLYAKAVGQVIAEQFPRTWALFSEQRGGPAT